MVTTKDVLAHLLVRKKLTFKYASMKTNLLFYAFLLLIPFHVFGYYDDASLQIDFNSRNSYIVQLGYDKFMTNGSSIIVDQLDSGFHPVTIYEVRGRKKRVVYSGGVNLAAASITYAEFYRGYLTVTEVVPLSPNPNFMVMNDAEFSRFMDRVNNESFESGKLDLLKTQIHYQFFTSLQVARIMDEFSFDSNRLDFAKLALAKTVDPQNYYLVSEKLSFNSNRQELNQFILSQSR